MDYKYFTIIIVILFCILLLINKQVTKTGILPSKPTVILSPIVTTEQIVPDKEIILTTQPINIIKSTPILENSNSQLKISNFQIEKTQQLTENNSNSCLTCSEFQPIRRRFQPIRRIFDRRR